MKEEQDLHVSPSFQGDRFQKTIVGTAKYVPCGALKSLLVFHLSAYYIFWSFGIIEHMLVCFAILLKPALGSGGGGKFHISVSLMNRLNDFLASKGSLEFTFFSECIENAASTDHRLYLTTVL